MDVFFLLKIYFLYNFSNYAFPLFKMQVFKLLKLLGKLEIGHLIRSVT